jgi:magnesium transporter
MPSFRALQPKSADPHREDIHVPVARAMVDCAVYVDGRREPGKFTHGAALAKARDLRQAGIQAFVWIGLHDPDEHQMQAMADVFGLHELAVADVVHAHRRPKLQRFDDTLFLVLKTVNYVENESVAHAREIVETGEIMIFVGADFVVTVRHGEHGKLARVRQRLDASPTVTKLGPYAVVHAIADDVVDHYLEVTDMIEVDIDTMEEDIFSPRSNPNVESIYLLKREVVELRRSVAPLTLALRRLASDHNDLISNEVRRYMRDVLEHQIEAAERINSYDDMLSSLVSAALGKVAMQQNVDMRKISAWVAIAAVPTAVAGIYGMNFDFMPELHTVWGYPAVLTVICVICALLYRTFRRNKWL